MVTSASGASQRKGRDASDGISLRGNREAPEHDLLGRGLARSKVRRVGDGDHLLGLHLHAPREGRTVAFGDGLVAVGELVSVSRGERDELLAHVLWVRASDGNVAVSGDMVHASLQAGRRLARKNR